MREFSIIISLTLILVFFTACDAAEVTSTPTREFVIEDTATLEPAPPPSAIIAPTLMAEPVSTFDTRLPPERWKEWPAVPSAVSIRVQEIYIKGQLAGNNPQAYSKIGDCESTPAWFLGAFDGNPSEYSLGEYGYLEGVIDNFRGSHSRVSLAAGRGFTAANVLTPLWADRKICDNNESPLACEIRIHRPSFALVTLGTNDVYHIDTFDDNMRKIIDFLMENGVIPILATKADNLEGDEEINYMIAHLADEYDIPLWNFWAVVQPLPKHGLQDDGSHLTVAGPYFDDPARMTAAWPWRNLTALQMLDLVWNFVESESNR